MPNTIWTSPIYKYKDSRRNEILIDVTSSVSLGLSPTKKINLLIEYFQKKEIKTILDFGAGALRHTLPLLNAGFQVCAVEYEEQFNKDICRENLEKAKLHSNFSKLIYPKDFLRDNRKFDAALLIYVIQTMPKPKERVKVLKAIYKKLNIGSVVFYLARYGQIKDLPESRIVSDGYYMWPGRKYKSFVREFTTEETHNLFKARRFRYIKSLSERGTEQAYLYAKGSITWI